MTLLGVLMYLGHGSRGDVLFPIIKSAQVASNPSREKYEQLMVAAGLPARDGCAHAGLRLTALVDADVSHTVAPGGPPWGTPGASRVRPQVGTT